MSTVRDRLREHQPPGEAEAAARAWPLVEAALAEREAAGRDVRGRSGIRRGALRLALVCGLLGAGLLAALTPAGAEVGDWLEDRFERDEAAAPGLASLPEGGAVLAISRSGAYAVRSDGNSQHLGPFSDAGWSPRGLHVVGVDGRRVVAVDPMGTPKWSIARRERVHHPAWSLGRGYAVAYVEGRSLRVVAGDGDPDTDRFLRARTAPVTPAWRARSDRILSYATTDGGIETIDTANGRMLWRTEQRERVRTLAWTSDGRRLVALSADAVTVLDATGRSLRRLLLPGAGRRLALHPSGGRAAVVIESADETRVVEVPLAGGAEEPARDTRQLFQGDVDGLAWSQDGRYLLLSWRATGQWLVIAPGGHVRALHEVSRELGAAGGFPRVVGWCCPG
jgi:hypothetical protein